MFKSVFAKYITTFMLIIFVSFLLLVLLITAMVNNYAVNAKKKLLDNTADFAAGYLSDRMESGNTESDAFAKMILRMSGDVDRMLLAGAGMGDDITLLLVDKNGRILRMASGGKGRGRFGQPAAKCDRRGQQRCGGFRNFRALGRF